MVVSEQADFAAFKVQKPQQCTDDGRFARAIGANEADDFAWLHAKVDATERKRIAQRSLCAVYFEKIRLRCVHN